MACFLMWIVIFIMLSTSWRYMVFAWFTRKDKDFSQVQSGYCRRLRNDRPHLEECWKLLDHPSSKGKVLNRNQCVHLLEKLIFAMKEIDKMLSIATMNLKFQFVCEELFVLQKKVEIMRNNCIAKEQWCHSIVFQLQNKETFRELLLDLKCCYDAGREMYLFYHPNQSNGIPPILFDAVTYDQVLEDGQELKKKLELVLPRGISKGYDLAQHLLLRLRNLDRVDGGDLNALEVPKDFKPPKLIQKIGEGSYGSVHLSNWLGLTCATKVLRGDPEYLRMCQKEVGILAGLSHPNLIQFFGCGIIKKVGENSKEVGLIGKMHFVMQYLKSSLSQIIKSFIQFFGLGTIQNSDENLGEGEIKEMHLVMELMDSNLSTVLKEAKRPLLYHVALDIMLQIAKGVYYLHDMQVAHLDLKLDNVLCSSIPMDDLVPYHIFKVTDYGTSQLEVCNNPKSTRYQFGTPRYMAPEMNKKSETPQYLFQADVWSFAMICSEILSRKVPFSDLEPKEICNKLQGLHGSSFRPSLPNDCEELTNLIQECWSQDPLQRPTFSNICDRLTSLKKSFLKEGSCALRDSKSIVNHVPKVNGPIAPLEVVPIGLNHQLSKAKGLLKMKYIGIVGMGGIGKTTLAKAIFDDSTVNSSYDASCFVTECKNYQNSYEILCKILLECGNDCKPPNLEEAQKMMKELLLEKKVLLILDDIKDESQVHDIVPSTIVQPSKGTAIIITTRQWSTIESFVGIEGRLDVKFLDEKASMKLFTWHLRWGEASLSPDFEALHEQIVQACNGLPLSLKVMGAFLCNKQRLRSWERALQRMARGRNLEEDDKIWNTLRISFDGLNDGCVEQRMFLDMACFFCRDVYPFGISKSTILSMWSKDGALPMHELGRLIDMSLLTVNGDGDILEMHDQLRDMGRMMAKHTRIWKVSMLPESGFSSKDLEDLEGISLQGTMNHHVPLIKLDRNFDFKKLRLLTLGSTLDNSKAYNDHLGSILQIASQCSQLEAIMSCCSNLIALPKEVGNLSSLTTLHLSRCKSLVALPKKVGNLTFLTTLDLSLCFSLVALPKEVGNLTSLTTLHLSLCFSLAALPKEAGNLSSLTTLHLRECSSLAALPKEVGNLTSLTTLHLRECSNLIALPKEVGNLSSLTTLDLIGFSSLVALPKEVGNLTSLTTLHLSGCSSLVALPKEVGNLTSLTTLHLSGCSSLVALPKEVGNLSSLTTLDLRECSSLAALPKEVGNLSSLTTVDLSGCKSLAALPKEAGNLSSLTTLHLREYSSLAALPKEVGNLSSLTTLHLIGCSSLVALPKEVGNLTSLTTLHLSGCSSLVALPKEVEKLYHLVDLNLNQCVLLRSLPKNLECTPSMQILSWNDCPNLGPYMLALSSPPTSVANLEGKFFCLEGDHHYGVTCDGCNVTPIIGPRFKAKATFKIDYDLCLDCFTK